VKQYYWPTFAMALWSMFTAFTGFCGVFAFFFGICLHVAVQFDFLSDRLKNLVQQEVDDGPSTSEGPLMKLSEEQNKNVQEKLTGIVKQQEPLIELCDLMTQSFSWIIALHFISSAIVISTCIFLLFLVNGMEWLQYSFATLSLLMEASVFAYAGHTIISSSTGMSDAAYSCEWYKCDAKTRKMILLIMTRSQKKICMKAPFFEASLESFVTVRTLSNESIANDQVSPTDFASCVFLLHILTELHVNLSSYQLLVRMLVKFRCS